MYPLESHTGVLNAANVQLPSKSNMLLVFPSLSYGKRSLIFRYFYIWWGRDGTLIPFTFWVRFDSCCWYFRGLPPHKTWSIIPKSRVEPGHQLENSPGKMAKNEWGGICKWEWSNVLDRQKQDWWLHINNEPVSVLCHKQKHLCIVLAKIIFSPRGKYKSRDRYFAIVLKNPWKKWLISKWEKKLILGWEEFFHSDAFIYYLFSTSNPNHGKSEFASVPIKQKLLRFPSWKLLILHPARNNRTVVLL